MKESLTSTPPSVDFLKIINCRKKIKEYLLDFVLDFDDLFKLLSSDFVITKNDFQLVVDKMVDEGILTVETEIFSSASPYDSRHPNDQICVKKYYRLAEQNQTKDVLKSAKVVSFKTGKALK